MFLRSLTSTIKNKLGQGKAVILIGPRQVGKTTLLQSIISKKSALSLDCDDPVVRELLTLPSTEQIKTLLGKHKLIFIDEAQRVNGIGITLKIIVDQFKDVQLLVSGSSSFELSNELNEPLTGRKWQYELLPISWEEYENELGFLKSEQQLHNRLLYGFYPDVINNQGQEEEVLSNLVESYLFRDILKFSHIRKPEVLDKLVQALAFQLGNEVSYNELAQMVGVDKNTINSYIDILEKGFVVFKLSTYSNNLRNEIKTNKKIYFYDNGIRNMIIGDFTDLRMRNDKGALWENFLISERVKQINYHQTYARSYFWRTKQQQEVDYVEVKNGEIEGFEFKWKAKPNAKLPLTFVNNYGTKGRIIDRHNFRKFVNLNQD
jgi:uncharacterized protein